jgi:hypothetical protein
MRTIGTIVARVLLLMVILFFFGPQLGSLDVDGDGLPDVPVIVTPGNSQNVQAPKSDEQDRIVAVKAPPSLAPVYSDQGLIKRRSVVAPRDSRLDSVPPLRC